MNNRKEENPDIYFEIDKTLEEYGYDKGQLIKILQVIQDKNKYLSEKIINYIAISLGMPPAKIYGVATFYAHFSLKPKGKYVIKICDGTACHVKGSIRILDTLIKELGLRQGESTTSDMLFSIETVSCLGACGLAPVILVNDKVYGQLKAQDIRKIISEIREKEKTAISK